MNPHGNDDPTKPPKNERNNEDNVSDIVRVTGSELGEGLNRKQLKEAARQYAYKNFVGTRVVVESIGKEVHLSRNGIRHTLHMARNTVAKEESRQLDDVRVFYSHKLKEGPNES